VSGYQHGSLRINALKLTGYEIFSSPSKLVPSPNPLLRHNPLFSGAREARGKYLPSRDFFGYLGWAHLSCWFVGICFYDPDDDPHG
jgi:hypothetical protein